MCGILFQGECSEEKKWSFDCWAEWFETYITKYENKKSISHLCYSYIGLTMFWHLKNAEPALQHIIDTKYSKYSSMFIAIKLLK